MMKLSLFIRISIISILMIAPIVQASAQTQQRDNRPRTASISGRVTIAGKPAANAKLTVTELNREAANLMVMTEGGRSSEVYNALTDADGRYRVFNLPDGKYEVQALLGSCVREKPSPNESLVESVSLDEGEARANVDFALVRGGVITGRVTDADGRPLIARIVSLQAVDEKGLKQEHRNFTNWEALQTDDRGVYRVYALRAGRYFVSAGGPADGGLLTGGASKYPRTWHPGVADANQAKGVEVTEGGEVTGVDIRLGAAKNTYGALGRVVDDETGRPVAGVGLICIKTNGEEGGYSQFGGNLKTDEQGSFRFDGLTPGKYQVSFADYESFLTGKVGDYYSDGATFEIQGADMTGLEIRAKRGATISGFAVLEDGDPTAKQSLSQTMISAQSAPISRPSSANETDEHVFASGMAQTLSRIGGDGSFFIKGLRPGNVTFETFGVTDGSLKIVRIERDGADVTAGIVITGRENISGVRVVLGKGTCRIRGQVQVTGGLLPEGWRLTAMATSERSADGSGVSAEVDAKGRFVFDGLLPGEYELRVMAFPDLNQTSPAPSGTPPLPVTQKVVVSKGQETQVTMTLDLSKKAQEERR